MFKHYLFQCAGLLSITIALAGCKSENPPAAPAPHQLAPTTLPQAAAKPDQPDDAALLAKRTAKYAQESSPLLQNRPATNPSLVKWVEEQTTPHLVEHAVAATLPSVAVNSKTPAKNNNNDVPQILPESADNAQHASAIIIPTDEYEIKLRQKITDYPRDLAGQLDYQLLRFVRDESTPDLATIAGLPSEDREIVSALIDGLSNFRNNVRADNDLLLSRKIQPLVAMVDRLRSQAELTIPTVALCTKVKSFGNYEPVAASRFAAGKENDVIVYCEVGNFNSIQNSQKFWETRLKQEMVLYTDTGMPVWPQKSNAQSTVDFSRNRRHDFFVARIIKLPADLTIGRYILKVTLTDEQTNRVAEISTPIEIVAE